MNRCRRRGLRIAIAAAVCLLFQQLALASYDCRELRPMPGDEASALCAGHCAPDSHAPADFAKAPVPGVALTLLASFPVPSEPGFDLGARIERPFSAADPPPRLRYCSLLI